MKVRSGPHTRSSYSIVKSAGSLQGVECIGSTTSRAPDRFERHPRGNDSTTSLVGNQSFKVENKNVIRGGGDEMARCFTLCGVATLLCAFPRVGPRH